MNGRSLNITEEKLVRLRELFPEAFSEEKVDWEKLRVVLSGDGEFNDERYHLNWAGKTDAFRVLQSPTTATLRPCREESIDFDGSGNLFIEGENLEVLKTLQKSYFGKVRMIYIDPPYNTGNDRFIYPDRFAESKDAYLKRIGDKDEQGRMTREGMFRKNSRENGHFHSNWLSMIYPRLFLARNLLRDDGVIFVTIDDNEVHNLRMVMNEIFGEDNFVANVVWQKKYTRANDARWFSDNHDHILVYAKHKDVLTVNGLPRDEGQLKSYSNPDNHPKGPWKATPLHAKSGTNTYSYTFSNGVTWAPPKGTYRRFNDDAMRRMEKGNEIWFGSDGQQTPQRKSFLSEVKEGVTPTTLWTYQEAGHNHEANNDLKALDLGGVFDNPKPIRLLRLMLSLATSPSKEHIILDFFAGSCTTAHAVLQLNAEDGGNRQFICIQMPESCDEKSVAYKSGYKTIADIGKERIRRVIRNDDLKDSFKVFKLQKSNFKTWRGEHVRDEKELEKQLKIHITPLVDSAVTENVLYELLLKSGLSLTAEIENKGDWFLVRDLDTTIALAMESIDEATIKTILAANPQKLITLDHLFQNNDQLKTNTALLMEDSGIEFQTV